MHAGELSALGERQGGELPAQLGDAPAGEHVPLGARGVVGLQAEVERSELRGRARDRDGGGRPRGRACRVDQLARAARERLDLVGRRRVVVEMALGVAHDADLRRDVRLDGGVAADDELRGSAADVDDQERARLAGVAGGGGAQERQPRLLVA
jgi:hypothetical protein